MSPHPGENANRIACSWTGLIFWSFAGLMGYAAFRETARFPFVGICLGAMFAFVWGCAFIAAAIWGEDGKNDQEQR